MPEADESMTAQHIAREAGAVEADRKEFEDWSSSSLNPYDFTRAADGRNYNNGYTTSAFIVWLNARTTLRAQLETAETRHAVTEREACRLAEQAGEFRDRCLAALERAAAAEARESRLLHAGAMLANCAYNLAQRDHLKDEERRSLELSRIAWDAARTKEAAP